MMQAFEEPDITDTIELLEGEETADASSTQAILQSSPLPLVKPLKDRTLPMGGSPSKTICAFPLFGIVQHQLPSFPSQADHLIAMNNVFESSTTKEWMLQVYLLHGAAKINTIPDVPVSDQPVRLVSRESAEKRINLAFNRYKQAQRDLASCGVFQYAEKQKNQIGSMEMLIDDKGEALRMSRGAAFRIIPLTGLCVISIEIIEAPLRALRGVGWKHSPGQRKEIKAEQMTAVTNIGEQETISNNLLERLQKNENQTWDIRAFYAEESDSSRSSTIDEEQNCDAQENTEDNSNNFQPLISSYTQMPSVKRTFEAAFPVNANEEHSLNSIDEFESIASSAYHSAVSGTFQTPQTTTFTSLQEDDTWHFGCNISGSAEAKVSIASSSQECSNISLSYSFFQDDFPLDLDVPVEFDD